MRSKHIDSKLLGQGVAGTGCRLVLACLLLAGTALPGSAEDLGSLKKITGTDPFANCRADNVADQDDPANGIINYPNTEIEPWVDANPADPKNLIAVWQQDRWSNGGARGNVAGFTKDGGKTWRTTVPPGVSACTGGSYLRASDPWVSISPSGVAYFMHLAFDPDPPSGQFGRNAMLVSRSTNGGASWSRPITLIQNPDGQALNDKNSITADPTNPNFVYAVWDQLVDFTLPPNLRGGGNRGARLRSLLLQEQAKAGQEAAPVFFKGPVLLARTTNGGRSWERAKEIYDPGGNAQTIGNQIVVQPNGTVVNFFNEIFTNGTYNVSLIRSFDKGRTFERRPKRVASVASSLTATITPDELINVRDAAVLLDIAVNPNNGRLYAVWQDTRFRGVDEVAFSQSTDNGNSWSKPVRINKTPANSNKLRQQAFIPSIAVGPDGSLVVTYYDFRNDNNSAELTDHWAVFCRANCDKATSWGDEARLTRTSFDMLKAPIARGLFLGDYMGLVTAGNSVYPVFGIPDGLDRTSLFTRPINFGGSQAVAAAP